MTLAFGIQWERKCCRDVRRKTAEICVYVLHVRSSPSVGVETTNGFTFIAGRNLLSTYRLQSRSVSEGNLTADDDVDDGQQERRLAEHRRKINEKKKQVLNFCSHFEIEKK